MDLNELGQDLNSLNAQPVPEEVLDEALMAQLPMFLDKYGTMFNNKRGIGVAILDELSRNNIDVSAADDAVQKILDQVRMEATQYMDALHQLMNDLGGFMDKVNTIDESVQAATNKVSGGSAAPGESAAPVDTPAPAPEPAPIDMATPVDMAAQAPAPVDMAAQAPAPMPAPAPVDMAAQAPAPMPAPAPMNMVSDVSKKTNIVNAAATRAPKASTGRKFSAGLLAAARGGR